MPNTWRHVGSSDCKQLILTPVHPITMLQSKLLKSPFDPVMMFCLNFSRSPWLYLHVLMHGLLQLDWLIRYWHLWAAEQLNLIKMTSKAGCTQTWNLSGTNFWCECAVFVLQCKRGHNGRSLPEHSLSSCSWLAGWMDGWISGMQSHSESRTPSRSFNFGAYFAFVNRWTVSLITMKTVGMPFINKAPECDMHFKQCGTDTTF